MTLVVFLVVCLLPALAFVLFSRGFDWLVRYEGHRPRPAPPTESLPGLAADLRRLTAEHEWLLHADVPGKATRLRAVQLAYDDTLLHAARLLEIDEHELPAPPLVSTTRLQAEAELATHGFTW